MCTKDYKRLLKAARWFASRAMANGN